MVDSATATSDFNFYLKFTKPLVLALPSTQDRALAACWIKKLMNDSAAPQLKNRYLKLLLVILQKKKLRGVFKHHPHGIAITEENLTLGYNKKQNTEGPDFMYDFSSDLLQYVAVQEIKDFGVHAMFAMSKQPIGSWDNTDNLILPKAASKPSNKENGINLIPAEAPAEKKPKESAELKKKKQNFAKSIVKSVKSPSSPIGKILAEEEKMKNEVEWQRPSWGSNLVLVEEFAPPSESTRHDLSDSK